MVSSVRMSQTLPGEEANANAIVHMLFVAILRLLNPVYAL